jgi:hypothetical protein
MTSRMRVQGRCDYGVAIPVPGFSDHVGMIMRRQSAFAMMDHNAKAVMSSSSQANCVNTPVPRAATVSNGFLGAGDTILYRLKASGQFVNCHVANLPPFLSAQHDTLRYGERDVHSPADDMSALLIWQTSATKRILAAAVLKKMPTRPLPDHSKWSDNDCGTTSEFAHNVT